MFHYAHWLHMVMQDRRFEKNAKSVTEPGQAVKRYICRR